MVYSARLISILCVFQYVWAGFDVSFLLDRDLSRRSIMQNESNHGNHRLLACCLGSRVGWSNNSILHSVLCKVNLP